MPFFHFIDFILIAIAIAAHYPIGRKIGISQCITATLVGLSFSGVIVGILANFSAGLIRPYLILVIAIGLSSLFSDLLKTNYSFRNLRTYIFIALLGILIFAFNNPAKVFLQKEGDQTFLLFNRHYSYFSSQSTEMLDADYFSRLKISNLFPKEWSRYHFFNSGTRSATMGLIANPGLFHYWFAQIALVILVMLSIIESFLTRYKFTLRNVILSCVWLVLGFTLFGDSLSWNFITTGVISVFAMAQLIISFQKKSLGEAAIFSAILGLSAFRLMPIALISLLVIAIQYLRTERKSFRQLNFRLIKPIHLIGLFLFGVYNLLTLGMAKESVLDRVSPLAVFDNSWLYVLSAYKFLGLYLEAAGHRYLYYYNQSGLFDPIFANQFYFRIASLIGLVSVLLAAGSFIKIFWRRWHQPLILAAVLSIILIPPALIYQDFFSLYEITIPYFLLGYLLLYYIAKRRDGNNGTIIFTLILFLGTFLFQFSGLSAIKEPAAYIVFDIGLWAIIGLFIFEFNKSAKVFYSALAVSVFSLVLLNPNFSNILRLPMNDRHSVKINISPLVERNTSEMFDSAGFMKNQSNPIVTDAYSAVLGARVNFSEVNSSFMNNTFIKKD